MNKKPCIVPTTVTAWGISLRYFRGIATKKSSRLETPSMSPIYLSRRIVFTGGTWNSSSTDRKVDLSKHPPKYAHLPYSPPAPRLRLFWVGGVSFHDTPESWEEHIVIGIRWKALPLSFLFVNYHLFCVENSRRETKKKKCQLRDSLVLNCPRLPWMVHRDWLVQKKKKPFV